MMPYCTISFLAASLLVGRQVPDWPYDKLFKHADLVVIAKAASTVDSGGEIKDKPPAEYFKGVLTTLDVVHVVKGNHPDKTLVVFHYRLDLKAGRQIANGPGFVQFHQKRLPVQSPEVSMVLSPPTYLIFLKRRPDGRWECVSGQEDPILSVKQLIEPLGPAR